MRLRQLLDVDVAEVQRVAVVLELDGALRVERLVAIPVRLHRHKVGDGDAIELYRHFVANHLDPESVPGADRFVGEYQRIFGIDAVIENAAGAPLLAGGEIRVGEGVPNLNLWRPAEINATVAALLDLPIDVELKIAVILIRAEAFALAVEDNDAVFNLPVLVGRLVTALLSFSELFGRRLEPLRHRHSHEGPGDFLRA